MKLKSTIVTFLFALGVLTTFSCSEDDAAEMPGGTVPCGDYLDELNDISAASQAFSNNPTPATCEAYKSAMMDFYNEFKDCPFYENSSYEETINSLESIDCSEY